MRETRCKCPLSANTALLRRNLAPLNSTFRRLKIHMRRATRDPFSKDGGRPGSVRAANYLRTWAELPLEIQERFLKNWERDGTYPKNYASAPKFFTD